jgi:hypothetical protein
MGRYYDIYRQSKEFGIRDMVWLKTNNIRTRQECKKLDHKKVGPYKITRQFGPLAYQLDLPNSLPIHNIFHVKNLEKAHELIIKSQRQYPQGLLEAIPDKE